MDIVCLDPDSNTPPTSDDYFGLYSKISFSDFQSEYPNIVILTGEEMSTKIYEAAKKPVSEISINRYTDMLEVLPPLRWVSSSGNTTFMLSERFTNNITDIFAKIQVGDDKYRYFTFCDEDTLTHCQIVEKVMLFLNR
ncbi:UNVERIFIED_ASMBLY: DUF1419 domain-containing protein [Cronobacter sakazakii]